MNHVPTVLSIEDLPRAGFKLVERPHANAQALMLVDETRPEFDPLVVDFLSGQMQHRLKNGLNRTQPLAKALGLKSYRAGDGPRIVDATAGMGTDAFIMAAMGCRVRSLERSPVIFALLEDGLRRLREAAAVLAPAELRARVDLADIASRLSFENVRAHDVLVETESVDQTQFIYDVIYLDPMYPEENRSKSALPKKEMQVFRRLLGDDVDGAELLESARRRARERVVVKRPVYAAPLAEGVTHAFEGKTARFDMYLTRK